MIKNYIYIYFVFLAVALTSCSLFSSKRASEPSEQYSSERKFMEEKAQKYLSQARQQLEEKQYDKAKATVATMRKECYLALAAREEGILLMDSIELCVAKDNLVRIDSFLQRGDSDVAQEFQNACQKVQFFERKLNYDKRTSSQKQ